MKYSNILYGTKDLDLAYINWYTHPELFNGDCGAFNQHMPLLRFLCHGKRVVELGSRYGVSTLAILASRPEWLISVDIEKKETISYLQLLASNEGIDFDFWTQNDLTVEIPTCDILFIDTLHDYDQLVKELALHADKARECIIGHDLVSFGEKDESDPNGRGLILALEEFLTDSDWESASYWFNCNGLWALRRATGQP